MVLKAWKKKIIKKLTFATAYTNLTPSVLLITEQHGELC